MDSIPRSPIQPFASIGASSGGSFASSLLSRPMVIAVAAIGLGILIGLGFYFRNRPSGPSEPPRNRRPAQPQVPPPQPPLAASLPVLQPQPQVNQGQIRRERVNAALTQVTAAMKDITEILRAKHDAPAFALLAVEAGATLNEAVTAAVEGHRQAFPERYGTDQQKAAQGLNKDNAVATSVYEMLRDRWKALLDLNGIQNAQDMMNTIHPELRDRLYADFDALLGQAGDGAARLLTAAKQMPQFRLGVVAQRLDEELQIAADLRVNEEAVAYAEQALATLRGNEQSNIQNLADELEEIAKMFKKGKPEFVDDVQIARLSNALGGLQDWMPAQPMFQRTNRKAWETWTRIKENYDYLNETFTLRLSLELAEPTPAEQWEGFLASLPSGEVFGARNEIYPVIAAVIWAEANRNSQAAWELITALPNATNVDKTGIFDALPLV